MKMTFGLEKKRMGKHWVLFIQLSQIGQNGTMCRGKACIHETVHEAPLAEFELPSCHLVTKGTKADTINHRF